MTDENQKKCGIYCIETVWYGSEDRTSVRPILEILEDHLEAKPPYVYRDAATTGELHYYLERWKELKDKFPILYLGFHGGSRGRFWMKTLDNRKDMVDYEVLADRLDGACQNSVVHFASCSSLNDMDLNDFREKIGASAVSGYAKDIYWIDSAAFELMYLYQLQYHYEEALTRKVAMIVKENLATEESARIYYFEMAKYLGFRMHVAPP